VHKVPPTQIYTLTSEKDDARRQHRRATRDAVFDILRILEQQVGKEDIFLLYYSGHGVRYRGEWFLTPVTAATETNGTIKEDLFISQNDLIRHLKPIDPRHMLVVLDSCFSGPGGSPGVRGWSLDPDEPDAQPWGSRIAANTRYVFTASTATQIAYEIFLDKERKMQLVTHETRPPERAVGHGLFTFSMLTAVERRIADSYRIGIDLRGDRTCGGKNCLPETAKIPDLVKSSQVRVPMDEVWSQLRDFVRKFWEQQRRGEGGEPLQMPTRFLVDMDTVPLDFRHHDQLEWR